MIRMFVCDLQHTNRVFDLIKNDDDCMVIIKRFIGYGFALFLDALDICVKLLQDNLDIKIQYCRLDLDKLYRDFDDFLRGR